MSSTAFRRHIRLALENSQLQDALDANAARRAAGRQAAFASLPHWRERRQRAHSVRAKVIEHLDELLLEFSARACKNGLRVHRAKDAAEAVQAVVDIAEGPTHGKERAASQGPLLFAKSKSMVSEEIGLNAELEKRGHRVVETDLGEFIVQLRGEKPAHIITPAVHLQRQQIARLFEEHLGVAYSEDIPALTAAARATLRKVFLAAHVGISGVNFGVADTGGICIVTNEGNGRMVTTMPDVHIALMGVERLVPTLDDLALMLSLLPRSATGQKLTVYTQLIHAPKGPGEPEGPRERHVILVDNGRLRMRDSGLREALTCIRCGACLNSCPVFRELGGHAYVASDGSPAPYPGPIGAVVSPGLRGIAQFGHLAQASSLCGACKDACPVDIDLPTLLIKVRSGVPSDPGRKAGVDVSRMTRGLLLGYSVLASSPGLFGLAQRLGALAARFVSPRSDWMRVPAPTGWGAARDVRRPAIKPFRQRWKLVKDSVRESASKPTSNSRGLDGDQGEARIAQAAPDLIGQLKTEMEALGAKVWLVERGDAARTIAGQLHSRGIKTILGGDDIERLPARELEEHGLRMIREAEPTVQAGITGCTCAIAETGTLVLAASVAQPLYPSLLPEVHVAVVGQSQIVATLEDALRMRQVIESPATVLISGPSRTADIEMTLTIGVHGPKEVLVYITREP